MLPSLAFHFPPGSLSFLNSSYVYAWKQQEGNLFPRAFCAYLPSDAVNLLNYNLQVD